jgi:hypothetical protein
VWLVLCSPHDDSAIWAYHGLRRRGLSPLRIVTAEALAFSTQFEHEIVSDGIRTRIEHVDGWVLDSREIRGSLNRVQQLPSDHYARAAPEERLYAQQELFAVFLSWLNALPGAMFNRPGPRGLCGDWRPLSEWIRKAGTVGLETVRYRHDEELGGRIVVPPGALPVSVIVFQGQCFGARLPTDVQDGCARLAEASATPLAGIDFMQQGSRLLFAGATPLPSLRIGGEAFLDELAAAFRS